MRSFQKRSKIELNFQIVRNSEAPWPHAPPHWSLSPGTYFVTAGTFQKAHLFDSATKHDLTTHHIIDAAREFNWQLRAWAVLSNHYHFLADSPNGSRDSLRQSPHEFHRTTAIARNQFGQIKGRRVWFNFRESHITHQTSFLARLRYVDENPVHHGLVPVAPQYRWCSAAWLESNAPRSLVESVRRFRMDRLKFPDDFD